MNSDIIIKTEKENIAGILNDCGSKHIFLLVHGFGANKKTKQFNEIEEMLNSLNISTLRIDFGWRASFFPTRARNYA